MAGMLAMIIGPKGAKQYERETGNKLGNLEEADRMLGDREWKSLTRDEKLAIRKMTGWQIGPGGDWMFETDRDPSLSEGFKRKYGDRYSYRDAEIAKTKKVADEVRRVRDSYRQLVKERGLSGNESYGEEFLPAEVLWDTPETMANHMRIWRGLLKDTMHESDPVKMSFLNDKKLLKAEADLAAHMETSKGRPDFSPYEGTLGDVLDFDRTPELLAAYPGLDKVKLRIEEREDGTLGEWNNETKTLTMTRRALEEKGLQGSLGTLLHELTHRVQDSEGFANGGSYLSTIFNRPSEIYWSFKSPTPENLPKRPDNYFYFGGSNPVVDNPASRVDRVMEQFWNLSSRNADYAERHPDDTAPLHSSHDFRKFIGPAWEGFHKGQYGLPDLTPLPEGNLSDPEVMNAWKEENYAIIRTALDGIMGPIRAYDSAVARAKEAERIEKERQDAINKTILEMQKRYDTSTNAIQDKGLGKYDELYRRIAGETGARNSELRMKMSQEERMGSLLEDTEDRKRAEQIDSRFGFGNAVDPEAFDEILREHPRMLQQAAKGGNTSGASGVRQAAGGGATKISYEDLRKLADTTYKGDVRAAVYSLDPKVVTATVDSFGGNIDRTNRPMYVHRDKDGKATGYSTTNSGDALDRGVKPEGRFQSVLVPFVRQGKDGPEYTEDYNVAQKWYDESGQHYGKFDMDFTTPEAKARSIDRFNAASWLVHREQQLRYQPEFDRLVEAERRQAAKAGDAGRSKSSGVPSGHNPALDGYTGPRIIVNPEVMHDKRDGLCVAWNEALRVAMEAMGYEPTSEPTDAQRRFFADTPYADDELQLRRTILARICVFDTSIS